MAIFNSSVKLPKGNISFPLSWPTVMAIYRLSTKKNPIYRMYNLYNPIYNHL